MQSDVELSAAAAVDSDCSAWGCTCQGVSDCYGVKASVTWGSAPEAARTWWVKQPCHTNP